MLLFRGFFYLFDYWPQAIQSEIFLLHKRYLDKEKEEMDERKHWKAC